MIIFYISAWGAICLHFSRHTVYVGKPHTHTIDVQSSTAKETEGGRKSKGGYIDEARGLLFSLLISLNLLIPILKPATLQCWCLLCVAPSQIKLSFIPVLFKHSGIHQSSLSFAFPPYVTVVLICSQTLCVNLVTSDSSVAYSYVPALQCQDLFFSLL